MRKELILVAAALTFGLAGGYAWSALNAPPPKAPRPAKAAMVAVPPSPEEEPLALDQEWTAEADDSNASVTMANASSNSAQSP